MSDLAHPRSADAPWKDALRAAYLDGRANIFLLHGAVSDYQWSGDGLTSLAGAVTELLGQSRSFVVAVDGAGDAWLSAVSDSASVRTAFAWARPGTREAAAVLDAGPRVLLPALGRLLGTPAHPCGVILLQAELLLGTAQDVPTRAAVAQVRRWLDSPHMRATNNAAVLIVDAPDAISPLLSGHPRLVPIEVGLPAVAEAVSLVRAELGAAVEGLGTDRLSAAVQGCTLIEVAALCSQLAGAEPEVLAARFPPVSPPPTDVLDVPEPPASLAPAAESPMSEPTLPSWADELRTRYQAGAAAIFLAHGATTDLHGWTDATDGSTWLEPADFFLRFLGRTRTAVVYDVAAQSLRFSSEAAAQEVRGRVDLRRKARGQDPLLDWPETPREVLPLLKDLLSDRSYRVAVVIHGVQALAPAAGGPSDAELTRGRVYDLVYDAPAGVVDGEGLLVFTTPELDGLDPRVRSAARVAAVVVPPPDFKALRAFLDVRLDGTEHDGGKVAAGLVGHTLRDADRAVTRMLRGDTTDPVAAVRTGPTLPGWADDLRERYLAGEASMFLVHGNVRDVYPWEDTDGAVTYVTLREFMERFLCRAKELVAYFNVSEGIEFPVPGMRERFLDAINTRRRKLGRAPRSSLAQVGDSVLSTFEELITGNDDSPSAAVILDYVEMIVPMGDLSFMGDRDKSNLVALQRWSSDPAFLDSDNVVVLCTENLPDVHRRLVASPQLAAIQIPLPTEAERLAYIRSLDHTGIELEMPDAALAKVTAGLSLVQVRGLFRRARRSSEIVTFRTVSRRKKSIIEQECHGLVEFVDPDHDFSHVGGMERLKGDLMRVARAIKNGHRNRVPMGIIFVGPMGTGKTFMAEAFAAESGLTCLKFKNFREKWVGSTEGNLEKILQVVDGLGYVLLIVDEADRSMGSASDGDGGTSSRVIARLKEFMSDTGHRGRIVVLMMTNRPDKLDADLKRPGRFDLKIPFFFPEDHTERVAVLEALTRKNKLTLAEDADLDAAADGTVGYSGAELESVLLAAGANAAEADQEAIRAEDLAQAVEDVIPSRDTRMLEFMEMLAVFESTNRRMLPERFQDLDTDAVHQRLDALRMQLGRRA